MGFNLDKSCVIPNGIDETVFVPLTGARRSVRSELGLPEDAFLLGIMGRYHPAKDHGNFLQAAALLSKVHPKTHFLLIGRNVDGKNRKLCHSIEQLGLASRTHLLGERHDTARLCAALDVFSLSSSYGESFPNVVGEAMACEVPCVVTDIGGTPWMVGQTGRVVPPRDPRAMAEAWQELINLGQEERRALGREARARVVEHFTLKAVAERYVSLYEKVLAGKNPPELTCPVQGALATLGTTLEETGAQ
nr:stp2: sugar transferase, PEP-CTERM/EpsH1 system [uncultured bacterium]